MFKATLIANPFWQGLHFLFFKLTVPVAFNMTYVLEELWHTCKEEDVCVCIWCACIWGRWIKAVQVYRRKATHFDKERVLSFSPLRLQYF